MISEQRQKELFGLLLEKLELEKSRLKAPEQPILDFGEKSKLPSVAGDDKIDKGSIENIFDVLGFFTTKNPGRVYLAPKTIYDYYNRNSVDIVSISEIVYIHECAHYIHYALNPDDFLLEAIPPKENSRKFYMETFAQLCTWAICVKLGKFYTGIFCALNKNQPDEYQEFKKYCQYYRKAITETFLKQNSTPYFNLVIHRKEFYFESRYSLLEDLDVIGFDSKYRFTEECSCENNI